MPLLPAEAKNNWTPKLLLHAQLLHVGTNSPYHFHFWVGDAVFLINNVADKAASKGTRSTPCSTHAGRLVVLIHQLAFFHDLRGRGYIPMQSKWCRHAAQHKFSIVISAAAGTWSQSVGVRTCTLLVASLHANPALLSFFFFWKFPFGSSLP